MKIATEQIPSNKHTSKYSSKQTQTIEYSMNNEVAYPRSETRVVSKCLRTVLLYLTNYCNAKFSVT